MQLPSKVHSSRNIGAVAELLDISCLYKNSIAFEAAEDIAFTVFNESESVTVQEVITTLGSCFDVLGQHYFVPNPFTGSGNSPVFDFRAASEKGNPNAYVLANKTGDVPAPTGKQDVDWLQLVQAQGQLAKHVFRLETKAGQPPSSVSSTPISLPHKRLLPALLMNDQCTPGSPLISVKYAAKYCAFAWLFSFVHFDHKADFDLQGSTIEFRRKRCLCRTPSFPICSE